MKHLIDESSNTKHGKQEHWLITCNDILQMSVQTKTPIVEIKRVVMATRMAYKGTDGHRQTQARHKQTQVGHGQTRQSRGSEME